MDTNEKCKGRWDGDSLAEFCRSSINLCPQAVGCQRYICTNTNVDTYTITNTNRDTNRDTNTNTNTNTRSSICFTLYCNVVPKKATNCCKKCNLKCCQLLTCWHLNLLLSLGTALTAIILLKTSTLWLLIFGICLFSKPKPFYDIEFPWQVK